MTISSKSKPNWLDIHQPGSQTPTSEFSRKFAKLAVEREKRDGNTKSRLWCRYHCLALKEIMWKMTLMRSEVSSRGSRREKRYIFIEIAMSTWKLEKWMDANTRLMLMGHQMTVMLSEVSSREKRLREKTIHWDYHVYMNEWKKTQDRLLIGDGASDDCVMLSEVS